MIATIISLDEVTKTGNRGRYQILTAQVTTDKGKRTYKLFSFKPGAADAIKTMQAAGVGAEMDLTLEKNEKGYWDLVGVKPVGGGQQQQQQKPGGNAGGGKGKPSGGNEFRKPDEIINTSAVAQAVAMMETKVKALAAGCTNVIKKTKLSGDLMIQEVLADAAKIAQFIKGEYTVDVQSSGVDLNPDQGDIEQDDIPTP